MIWCTQLPKLNFEILLTLKLEISWEALSMLKGSVKRLTKMNMLLKVKEGNQNLADLVRGDSELLSVISVKNLILQMSVGERWEHV